MTKKISLMHNAEYVQNSLGTIKLDLSTNCFPASTNFTSKAFKVGEYREIAIRSKCTTNFTTAIVTKYQISTDGANWLDGAASLTSLDTGVDELVVVTEKAVRFIRINADNSAQAEAGNVLMQIVGKA